MFVGDEVKWPLRQPTIRRAKIGDTIKFGFKPERYAMIFSGWPFSRRLHDL
jgi:hypothetical protein